MSRAGGWQLVSPRLPVVVTDVCSSRGSSSAASQVVMCAGACLAARAAASIIEVTAMRITVLNVIEDKTFIRRCDMMHGRSNSRLTAVGSLNLRFFAASADAIGSSSSRSLTDSVLGPSDVSLTKILFLRPILTPAGIDRVALALIAPWSSVDSSIGLH